MRGALDSVRRGELDRLTIPRRPLDVLAQQIVAEVAAQDWPEAELFDRLRRASPYRALSGRFRRGERACWRRASPPAAAAAARLSIATRQRRVARPARRPHDRADLGRHDSRYRRLSGVCSSRRTRHRHGQRGFRRREHGGRHLPARQRLLSHPARRARHGAGRGRAWPAAELPFWLGEAPGRADDSPPRCRACAQRRRAAPRRPVATSAKRWLDRDGVGIAQSRAEQLATISPPALGALGACRRRTGSSSSGSSTRRAACSSSSILPFGSRINRAWGLALRKRFCRKFNFELQAAATEDNIVLSLTTAHTFDLDDSRPLSPFEQRARGAHPGDAGLRRCSRRAGVGSPASRSALPRFRDGKKVPPQFLRMQADDLVAAVFPDQIACAGKYRRRARSSRPSADQPGDPRLPARGDGHRRAGAAASAHRGGRGRARLPRSDRAFPASARSAAARPYAFLDDAPLEERRTQAVMARRWLDPASASRSRPARPGGHRAGSREARPEPANAEELHDALLWLGCLTERRGARQSAVARVARRARARQARRATQDAARGALDPAERLTQFRALWPDAPLDSANRAAGR